MQYFPKLCFIFDNKTKILLPFRYLHFDKNGALLDVLNNEGFKIVEDGVDTKKFNPGQWQYDGNDFVEIVEGIFYKKIDASEFSFIIKDKVNEYTQILPLPKYEDGTTQVFNENLQGWEYIFKGEQLLAYEKKIELNKQKQKKLDELEIAFIKTKRITVVANETVEIINRDKFLNILQNVYRQDNTRTAHPYWQENNGIIYSVACIPEILNKVWKSYFFKPRESGIPEPVREYNKMQYDCYQSKINKNEISIEELNNITFNFYNPEGVDINVDIVANAMLQDQNVAQDVKDVINSMEKTQDGKIIFWKVSNV